jgi:hypothetical protein
MGMEQALADWFQRVWVEGDLDAVDEYFSSETKAAGMMTGFEIGAMVPAILSMVRNPSVSMEKTVETGEWLWALLKIDAQCAEDLKPVSINGQVMMRMGADGKIAEAYNHFDFISFFEQLGKMPQDTIALCLGGIELN